MSRQKFVLGDRLIQFRWGEADQDRLPLRTQPTEETQILASQIACDLKASLKMLDEIHAPVSAAHVEAAIQALGKQFSIKDI